MHIAVNVRHYLKGRIGGQENYLQAILRGLARRGQKLTIFAQPSQFQAVREMVGAPVEVWAVPEEGRAMLQAIGGGGFDLLFCPLHTLEPLDPPIPSAVMIPDLQHEFFPAYFDDRALQWRCRNYEPSARNASVVLTCSEFSKRTIVERYGVAAEKVVVCGHGVDVEFLAQPAGGGPPAEAMALPAEYLYFPAFYWPHKNHANAFQALKLLHERGHGELHLVCTGGGDWAPAQALVEGMGLSRRVKLLGRVEGSVVPELYRRSRGLLFPTLFEGFGIPVLEAMQLGVPVVTSRGGAAEEVAGGCAVLVEAGDPAAIANGVESVLADVGLRRRLTEAGRARAGLFSWDRAVDRTLEALQRVAAVGYRGPAQIEVTEWPVISVVICGEEAAASVRRQDYPHVEMLCGVEGCSGALVNVLRDGDEWLPGAAAMVAQAWRRSPRAGVIYGLARRGDGVVGRVPYVYEDLNYGPVWAGAAAFYGRAAFEGAGWLLGEGGGLVEGPPLPYGRGSTTDSRTGSRTGAGRGALDELRLALRVARGHAVVGLTECLAVWGHDFSLHDEGLEQVRDEAIELILEQFEYVPLEWIDGRAVLRLAGGTGAMSGRWPSLLRGLAVNRGRRQRYWHDWRQGGASR
ncbi:glycosyltransferase family 4 protein [Paludibaculum fermentans]|uniref:Glycosyltransferase family 4 protein n=1 Tax=Paludibaculum fermentans TaxID=1473598 RepID=A0A7S7NK69_PALFE|nr:glycosyltransferase family 1 protein [Paludibaculum fermentans]QOY85065.1 glycosyltransferase family 4 protein [Paludibaculum fermentans]